jgi:hypothetical protein
VGRVWLGGWGWGAGYTWLPLVESAPPGEVRKFVWKDHCSIAPQTYRIHILEKRLKRHEEQALHKYYDLDHRLRSDNRLAALMQL